MNSSNKKPLIALTGPSGGGKTWLINELGKKLESRLQALMVSNDIPPIFTLAFADPIYEAQKDIFDTLHEVPLDARNFNEMLKSKGLDNEIFPIVGFSPRNFRQKFGTELCRTMNPTIWVDLLHHKRLQIQNSSCDIILDVRFENELDYIRQENFHLYYINTTDVPIEDSHASESHFSKLREESDTLCESKEDANRIVDEIVTQLTTYIDHHHRKKVVISPRKSLVN